MPADDTSDRAKGRLERLKAMQAKHAAEPAAAAEPPARPAQRGAAAGAAAGSAAGIGAAGIGAVGGGVGGGGAGGARAAMVQRLRQALSGPDGRIDPQRARGFLQFVRKQAADPAAPRHELAKRIAGILKNLPPQQRQRLMAAAGLTGGAAGGLGGASGGGAGPGRAAGPRAAPAPEPVAAEDGPEPTGEAWFDDLVDKL